MIQFFVDKGFFRNVNHAIWFFCTVAILLAVLIQRLFPQYLWTILLIGLVAHLSPIINALFVFVKKQKSELYTKDCIFYNAAMIGMYVLVYMFLR